ncbi:MAG TPA: hypothetical protein VLN59_03195, partial [Burkholderiales bacterium]|nr:hypothetical protein [Burkholderiales bacterium]
AFRDHRFCGKYAGLTAGVREGRRQKEEGRKDAEEEGSNLEPGADANAFDRAGRRSVNVANY